MLCAMGRPPIEVLWPVDRRCFSFHKSVLLATVLPQRVKSRDVVYDVVV